MIVCERSEVQNSVGFNPIKTKIRHTYNKHEILLKFKPVRNPPQKKHLLKRSFIVKKNNYLKKKEKDFLTLTQHNRRVRLVFFDAFQQWKQPEQLLQCGPQAPAPGSMSEPMVLKASGQSFCNYSQCQKREPDIPYYRFNIYEVISISHTHPHLLWTNIYKAWCTGKEFCSSKHIISNWEKVTEETTADINTYSITILYFNL